MFRNKRYRNGTGARRPDQSTSISTNNTTVSTIPSVSSFTTSPPITSTPITKEPQPGPSGILTERSNIPANPLPLQPIVQQKSVQFTPTLESSQTVVPASQILPPSRYISQRSIRIRSQLTGATQSTPLTYFESVLSRCGVQLTARNSDVSYTLDCDHLKFVIRLRKELSTHAKFPENVQHFLAGLIETMKTQRTLIKVLSGCMITLSNSELSKASQESLMNDFLVIDFMQTDIIEILMNKIKVLAVEDNAASHIDIDLLLAQLKFVDHLANGDLVCEKIFEILELASYDARQTIIKSLEDIVDLMRHNDVVEKLMQLLPNDADLLTESTIDTLGNMCLSASVHANLCQKIIRYIKTDSPIALLPCFTKFILKFNNHEADTLPDIIENLRSCLKWPGVLPTTRAAIQKNQQEVFGCVLRSLIRSKQLFDVWLKRIQANTDVHKPIDLIVLLMMMTIKDEKSNYIENIIRRKIRSESIQIKLMEETGRQLPIILLDYSKIFFELLDYFVRDKNQLISNFASAAYRLVFGIDSCDRKVLLSKLVGFVCERSSHAQAISCTDAGTTAMASGGGSHQVDITTNALMILTEINRKYPVEMQNNGLQILRIIDDSNKFTLSQFRLVMNIVCTLAYTEPPCEQLKDQIDMLMKKQVSSSIRSVKNRGIIGVVRVIDHMIWERCRNDGDATEMNELNCSYDTIDKLPTKTTKVAANYIDLVLTSAQSCPNHLALFFDELATVFLQRNGEKKDRCVNKPFLIWLSDSITHYFENNFVVAATELPTGPSGLQLEVMRALNTDEEIQIADSECGGMIAINIAGGVLNPSSNSLASIKILSSLFGLMRILLSRRYDGNLNAISAVLGAGIVLPDIMSIGANVDIFDELSEERGRQVLDMYFYTVNYWRECVSAYVSQNETQMKRKVLTRLSEVIELEGKIRDILLTAPDDYVPPMCQFLSESTAIRNNTIKFKRPIGATKKTITKRKKAPTKATITQDKGLTPHVDEETMPEAITQPSGKTAAPRKKPINVDFNSSFNEFFRQMDANVILLFEENLLLKHPLPKEKIGYSIGLLEFKFLMEDLTMKVESIFGVRKFGSHADFCQSIPYPAHFISDIIEIIPKILNYFAQMANQLKIIIDCSGSSEIADETLNDDLFSDESNLIKICFGLCLRLLAALYTWPSFDDDVHHDLLDRALSSISGEVSFPKGTAVVQQLALVGLKNVTENSNVVIDLHSAVYMFYFARTLTKYIGGNAYNEHVVPLCEQFLSRKWQAFDGSEMRGAEYNVLLDQLLKGYFKDAKFSFIHKNLQWIVQEIKDLSGKSGILKTFPCFNKTIFPLLYRAIYSTLIDAMHRKIDKNVQSLPQLKIWENACVIINQLLEIAKLIDESRVFNLFLKNTHSYLKLFLQHGMSVVETSLRRNVGRVSEFLQNLQNSTRFLHSLCCHSKAIKHTAIIVQIPLLRETITQLVYKVKAALAANKCSSVFWMGNLRNKNLYGDEILSQTTSITRSSITGDNEDSELPNDDDDDDDDDDANSTSERRESTTKTKAKKRKLYRGGSNDDDDDSTNDATDQTDSSRSRCF